MAFDANGNYTLPIGYQAVTGQTILASQHNPPLEDVAAALSQVLLRSGVAPMNGNLDMGGFRIIGMGAGTSDGDAVTKAQLDAIVASLTFPGEIKYFARATAPAGWIKANGGTIGNAASGGTTRANADTINLFTVLWDNFSNTILPIQTSTGAVSTRGTSAATDYAANKRLPIFDLRGEFLRGWDDGRGVDTSRSLGAFQTEEVKSHTHAAGTLVTDVEPAHVHGSSTGGSFWTGAGGGGHPDGGGATGQATIAPAGAHSHGLLGSTAASGGTETRPRNVAFLACLKL